MNETLYFILAHMLCLSPAYQPVPVPMYDRTQDRVYTRKLIQESVHHGA